MQTYIGTKIIKASPMTRQQYNDYRGWQLPENENGDDEGYLVEYTDGGKPNHEKHEGYISWSPKEVFENAYNPTSGMTFGHALEMLKRGHRVTRAGWNGKGMWLILVPGTAHCQLRPGTPYAEALKQPSKSRLQAALDAVKSANAGGTDPELTEIQALLEKALLQY